MKGKIEIPLSKTKILLLLIAAIGFVVLGVVFVLNPEGFESSIFRNPVVIRMVGIASTIFFGLCSLFIIKKFFDKKVGLTIDQDGITDNTNGTSVGLVEWADILAIETLEIATTKMLILQTDKPEKYMGRAKNGIIKRAMKANLKMYGSPLSIVSTSLKIKFKDLEKLVREEFEKQKK